MMTGCELLRVVAIVGTSVAGGTLGSKFHGAVGGLTGVAVGAVLGALLAPTCASEAVLFWRAKGSAAP